MFDLKYKKLEKNVLKLKEHNISSITSLNKLLKHLKEIDSVELYELSIFEQYYNLFYNYNHQLLPQTAQNNIYNQLKNNNYEYINIDFEDLELFTNDEIKDFEKFNCAIRIRKNYISKDLVINLSFILDNLSNFYDFKNINVGTIVKNNSMVSFNQSFKTVYLYQFFNKNRSNSSIFEKLINTDYLFNVNRYNVKVFKFLLENIEFSSTLELEIYKYFKNIHKLSSKNSYSSTHNILNFLKLKFLNLSYPIESIIPIYNTLMIPESIDKIYNLNLLTKTKEFNILSEYQQQEVISNVINNMFVLNENNKEIAKEMIANLLKNIF